MNYFLSYTCSNIFQGNMARSVSYYIPRALLTLVAAVTGIVPYIAGTCY